MYTNTFIYIHRHIYIAITVSIFIYKYEFIPLARSNKMRTELTFRHVKVAW